MKIDQNYAQLSSMKRINSASDDAAGLAIAEKMKSLESGFSQAIDNTKDAINLGNVADGGLEGVGDHLGRIRELAVQASNGLLSDDDRSIIQDEVNQLKEGISDLVKNTEFNGIKLLDGSFQDKNIQNNPTGSGTPMNIANTGLETLGIADFDVTEEFDIEALDNAINQVTEARGEIGAQNNRFESSVRSNEVARENTLSTLSRIEDLDVASGVAALRQNQIIEQYQMSMQKQKIDQQSNTLNLLL